MAKQCTESSVANCWDLHAWNHANPWHQPNPNSNSSSEEDLSISTSFTNTNASKHTVESSRRLVEPSSSLELMGEAASDSHLWSQILLSNGQMHGNQDDYLKKLDNSWDFTNSTSFNKLEKNLNGLNENWIESEKLKKLSNLVSNCSIAPSDQKLNNHPMNHCSEHPLLCHPKKNFSDSTSSPIGKNRISSLCSSYSHDLKLEDDHRNAIGNQGGLNSKIVGDNSEYNYGLPFDPCVSANFFTEVSSFGNRLTKPLVDVHPPKSCLKPLNSSNFKKTSYMAPILRRRQGNTNSGKKKGSEDGSGSITKKLKNESSTVTSVKVQAPKVKLGDKIAALQQIVSPFGKTDTASVLLEAIGYIKFLEEQVQLLRNSYMKTKSQKNLCEGMERKRKGDVKVDLRNIGLCLIPTSCIPQVYRDNTGSDYSTPTYRGCLYR